MIRLTVRVVGNHPDSGKESILAVREEHEYNLDALDSLIAFCLKDAVESLQLAEMSELAPWQPEVSLQLFADEEEKLRPSLHLNAETVKSLAQANASFDFDPYTY